MHLTVEFLGLARRLARARQVQLKVHQGATLRDAVAALASHFPPLLGPIIVPQTFDLVSPYFFNVGGRLSATDLEALADAAEPLVLMSLEAGG